MEYGKPRRTDISVTVISLGSMTWGEQNSEQDAHRQLDLALEQLQSNLQNIELRLDEGLLAKFEAIHASRPNPVQ